MYPRIKPDSQVTDARNKEDLIMRTALSRYSYGRVFLRIVALADDRRIRKTLPGVAAKLGLLLLIAFLPGGLPLALSLYICQRSKRAASSLPVHRWISTALRYDAPVFGKDHRWFEQWERTP